MASRERQSIWTAGSAVDGRAGDTAPTSCPSRMARARWRSSAPSHRATTIVATALPIRFVIARASDMKRSTPSSNVMAATGTEFSDARVAAKVMKLYEERLLAYQAVVVISAMVEIVQHGDWPKTAKPLAAGVIEMMDVFLIAIVAYEASKHNKG